MGMNGLIASLICAAIFAAGYFIKTRSSGGKTKEKIKIYTEEFRQSEQELINQLHKEQQLASAKQIASIQSQLSNLESSITQERAQLTKVEETLAKSQQNVEERENNHQNMKIAKIDEDERVQQLLEKHEALSAESIQLEKELAEAMKNLDSLINESAMTDDQKAMLTELQNTLETAGARLRELIAEYESVKSRVDALRQQHLDLEEEYTRLVELQLG